MEKYIYISGSTRVTQDNLNENLSCDLWLEKIGCQVVNGQSIIESLPPLTTELNNKLTYTLIELSNGICMPLGWQKDKQCYNELNYAKSLGKKVIYQKYFKRFKQKKEIQNENL